MANASRAFQAARESSLTASAAANIRNDGPDVIGSVPVGDPGPPPTTRSPVAHYARSVVLALHRAWWAVCAITLVGLIAGRAVRYLPLPTTPDLERRLGSLMIVETQAFVWPWALTAMFVETGWFLLAVIPLLLLRRRIARRLVRRADGHWRFTPLAVSLLCGLMVWLHYLFDL